MEELVISFSHLLFLFGRNVVGCINSPYITYRNLSKDATDIKQTLFFPVLIFVYFSFVSLLRLGISSPFLLTLNLNTLLASGFIGFFGMVLLLFTLGRFLGGGGSLTAVYTLWSFSLIPTLIWFFFTSIMFIFLPPPRSLGFLGKFYSIFFLTLSISLFIWKTILYYLTLRFALKLDLFRIILITAIVVPAVAAYSLVMYRLGVFRIPFL